jgi:hypothetical protein
MNNLYLQIKRNADTQLYTLWSISSFLLYPLISSGHFIKYPALFILLTLLNVLSIAIVYLISKQISEFKKGAFIYFVFFIFLVLPLTIVIHNRAIDTGDIKAFFQNVFGLYQYYEGSILYNWTEMWIALIILFSPATIIYARASYSVYRHPLILSEFKLSSATREINYFSFKNKSRSELIMYFLLLALCIFIIAVVPLVLFLVGLVCFALQRAELLLRLLFKYHDDYIRLLRRFYNKAQANITDRLFTVLKKDTRPPILWIRSFNDDSLYVKKDYAVSFEERVVKQLKLFGPVIAIGCPQEKQPLIGAAREYFKDSYWKSVIDNFIDKSNYIICVPGNTRGLEVEYKKIKNSGKQNKLVLLFPPVSKVELLTRWNFFDEIFNLDKGNSSPVVVNEKLVLIKLDDAGIDYAVYSDDKRSDTYRLAFNKILSEAQGKTESNDKKFSAIEAELTEAIGYEPELVSVDQTEGATGEIEYVQDCLRLHELIMSYGGVFGKISKRKQIITILERICTDQKIALQLMSDYKRLNKEDIVEQLIQMSSSYISIAENLDCFIRLEIVSPAYPHALRQPA